MNFRVRFKISITSIMLLMLLSLSVSIFTGLWYASSEMAEDVAANLFSSVSLNSKENVNYLLERTKATAAHNSVQSNVIDMPYQGLKSEILPSIITTLKQNTSFYSMYYGFENGTFFQVIAVRNRDAIRIKHNAPKETQWIVRSIIDVKNTPITKHIQQWSFLDKNVNLIKSYDDPASKYDPRKRPWYINAIKNNDVNLSSAYIFNSLKQPGITASKRILSQQGVFGVDLTLNGLAKTISAKKVSENGGVILYDNQNRLLAASSTLGSYKPLENLNKITSPAIKAAAKATQSKSLQNITEAGKEFLVDQYIVSFEKKTLTLSVVAPKTDFQSQFTNLQQQLFVVCAIIILIFIPISYGFSSRLAKHVTLLAKTIENVAKEGFVFEKPASSRVVEFNEFIQAFYHMNDALEQKSKALKAEQDKLTRLIELGIAMSSEQDSDKLMEMVLLGAKELTNADGGTLYILNEEQKLQFQIVRNDSLNIALGGTTGQPVNIPPVSLFDDLGNPNKTNVVSYAVHQEKSVNIANAYDTNDFDFSGTRLFDNNNNYKSESFLTVPLKPRGGEVIGALQIINARTEDTDEIIPFGKNIQPFIEALAAQAATALYNRNLLDAEERMMDALIHLIAGAIDAKSPYTGGHCGRVPELSISLAKAAGESNIAHLADFEFKSHEEWREFEIGAWLHDCGKVITPEYVVDKATKLETIYNRIHEVRTRYEVLLRDCEIKYLKSIAQGHDAAQAKKEFDAQKETLFDDYAFIAECNIGGEFLEDDKISRLQEIAKTPWMRNFNIQLGLSQDELKRYENEPEGPCEETLLNDKSLHVIKRETSLTELFETGGFTIDIPENLYNRGEIYNLGVKRGTLTEEERFKINEHVIQTILMLETLPLPKHMQRIPEYAGTHHETMNGSGYPRKLDETELSIPSRIMAIADVFEALTASDRPYKPIKTLSEAIKILSFFKKDSHIDPVLFDLFLTSGIYREYGEKYLLPEQIDEVDISLYIG